MFYTGLINEARVIVHKRLSLVLLIFLFVLSPVVFVIQRVTDETKSSKYTSLGMEVTGSNKDECLAPLEKAFSWVHSYSAKTEESPKEYTSGPFARLATIAVKTIKFFVSSPISLIRRLYFYSPKDWHFPINTEKYSHHLKVDINIHPCARTCICIEWHSQYKFIIVANTLSGFQSISPNLIDSHITFKVKPKSCRLGTWLVGLSKGLRSRPPTSSA